VTRILGVAFVGGLAGLIAWAIMEPFAPKTDVNLQSKAWQQWQAIFVIVVGGGIGSAICSVRGFIQGSRRHMVLGAVGGALIGATGGLVGIQLGSRIAEMVFGSNVFDANGANFAIQVASRVVVFIPFGAMIGLAVGIPARSLPRAIQGMIAGVIGGAIGGLTFDLIATIVGPYILLARGQTSGEVGVFSRAVMSVVLGLAIGLFVGIVERVSRKAWLRLELGRNEGKEWIIDAPRTFIGRSETAHVPLFGDPSVMPMHACIERRGSSYRLLDGGAPIGIGLNGIRVPEAVLNHGDIINIGSFQLRFLLRNPRSAISHMPVDTPSHPQPVAMGIPSAPTAPHPSVAAEKGFRLVALDGPMKGQHLDLLPGECIAGRESPQINLGFDSSASRRHAAFIVGAGQVLVRDLGSTNGTLVNGVRVQEIGIRPGDTVKIGMTTFRLE
jgi:pSer/pThr/pTyr-binding forkhead associated (FHA) protein